MVHVYILAGQSNMLGHADIATKNKTTQQPLNGTLLYQLHDPRTRDEFQRLWDNSTNSWKELSNVKIWFNSAGKTEGGNGTNIPGINGRDYSAGNLTAGYGVYGLVKLEFIGPELGFGFNIDLPPKGSTHGDKVLLIKTAWGGTDLAQDWRPPTSVGTYDPYCQLPKCKSFRLGPKYRVMLEDVEKLLQPGVLSKIYPDLEGMIPDIAGFGWFQGWNDGCDANMTAAYETNMVHLIQDLRRAWNKPRLPVAIGISGFDGWEHQGQGRSPADCWDGPNATKIHCHCDGGDRQCRRIDIMLSQIAAANLTKHPELECCVEAIETRNFWRPGDFSPSHQGFHFNHNAETMYLIGKAMAEGMNRIQHQQSEQSNRGINFNSGRES
eukprot:scaffold8614_cov85-Cylindrotheca_fusiformis.AAC.2